MTERQPLRADETLDQAIARLQRGSSSEPHVSGESPAADVAPLVALAAHLHDLAVAPPPAPGQLRAGREHLLAAARAARSTRRPTRRFSARILPVSLRWAAAAAMCVALVTAFLAGSRAMASASSLPGDPFYPVKRAAESVQLALAFAPEQRAALEQAMQERRLAEVHAILERHRHAQASFRGTVTALYSTTIEIAGLVVHNRPSTPNRGQPPSVGDVVAVLAQNQPEVGLVAESIQVIPPTPLPPIMVYASASAPSAAEDTLTPTPPITEIATTAVSPTGAVMATVVPTSSVVPTVTLAFTNTVAAIADWRGTLEAVEGDQWRVAGHSVLVDDATLMDEGAAVAEPGTQVRVLALAAPDAMWRAVSIALVADAASGTPPTWAIGGTLSALETDRWIIGGWPFLLTPETVVLGEPTPGALVAVSAHARDDGTIVVDSAAIAPEHAAVVLGTIELLEGSNWQVNGVQVQILPEALLIGEPQLGAQAAVWGESEPGGALSAQFAWVRPPLPAEPPATATLTPAPTTATPTPKATATP